MKRISTHVLDTALGRPATGMPVRLERSYFATTKITALYPLVEVTFRVRDGETHFHIPLLLSPNGYTTYRGS